MENKGLTITMAIASEAKLPKSDRTVFKKPFIKPIKANTASIAITIISNMLIEFSR